MPLRPASNLWLKNVSIGIVRFELSIPILLSKCILYKGFSVIIITPSSVNNSVIFRKIAFNEDNY